MSYNRYPDSEYREREPGQDRSDGVVKLVNVVTGAIATIFVLHIAFTVAGANEDNALVSVVYQLAKTLVLGLGDVFTPDDATIGVVLNYGFAVIVYLVIGRLIVRAIQRR